jgi:hypothetical protein
MQSIQPGPILPLGGQQVTCVLPPVHVSPPLPGESGLRLWCLSDTEEPAAALTWLVAFTGPFHGPPPGFTYWTSVEVQPEYGITAHVFTRRTQ